jgi:hydrogenase maturation protein HypF
LRRDQVVALQGVGGFQLLVRAASAVAVAELRRRKGRPEQPFAVLVPHLAWARRHCQVSAAEARLLVSPAAPIVLLRRRGAPLADGVAPHTPWLGVMLPASPLHALLLDAVGEPLVATSGNRSGEPLGFSEADGLDLLTDLADGLLSHNRPIANPVDDGVAQVAAGTVMVLRQARGTAPTAITLPDPATPPAEQPGQPHQPRQPREPDGLLAMGGQVKSAIAIGQGRRALLGPHLGDLGTLAGERRLSGSLLSWLERQQLRPSRLAIDLHPGYSAHRLGRELAETWGGLPVLAVQHHHAHLLACLAEHGPPLPATGVAWDGAGFGPDGLLWGGEALRLEPPRAGAALGFTHLARLRPFPLPGGERALREPRRAALGLLVAAFGADSQAHTPPATRAAFGEGEQQLLERLLQTDLKTPLCTSMGRLFDALASLLGLVQRCSFEGQGALRLQAAAQAALDAPEPQGWPTSTYRLPIGAAAAAGSAGGMASPWELDWQPLLLALLDDLARGRPVPSIALAFHRALAAVLVELAQRLQLRQLLLSGGCFQNRLLLELAVAALAAAGVEAVWPQRVPCNDGSLALGQLLALAWSACEEGTESGVQTPFLAL